MEIRRNNRTSKMGSLSCSDTAANLPLYALWLIFLYDPYIGTLDQIDYIGSLELEPIDMLPLIYENLFDNHYWGWGAVPG